MVTKVDVFWSPIMAASMEERDRHSEPPASKTVPFLTSSPSALKDLRHSVFQDGQKIHRKWRTQIHRQAF
jgi:hypothetical protein